jgi:hypothetical protein
MKTFLAYVALLILLIVGASIDNGGLEAASLIGMIGIALFYFATFRGKINSSTESILDAQYAIDSSVKHQLNIDHLSTGSTENHSIDHGNHHHSDGGMDSSSWIDSSDSSGAGHSD